MDWYLYSTYRYRSLLADKNGSEDGKIIGSDKYLTLVVIAITAFKERSYIPCRLKESHILKESLMDYNV